MQFLHQMFNVFALLLDDALLMCVVTEFVLKIGQYYTKLWDVQNVPIFCPLCIARLEHNTLDKFYPVHQNMLDIWAVSTFLRLTSFREVQTVEFGVIRI